MDRGTRWVRKHTADEIQDELERLPREGLRHLLLERLWEERTRKAEARAEAAEAELASVREQRDALRGDSMHIGCVHRYEAAEAELASVRHALHLLELHHHCYCKWPHPSECEAGIRARALLASQPLPSESEEQ